MPQLVGAGHLFNLLIPLDAIGSAASYIFWVGIAGGFTAAIVVLGGKTLRLAAGVEMAFRDARPVVALRGVSVMGIPIPNAWLGGLKNIDLVSEFGDQQGFWKQFAEGVDDIRVVEGRLQVSLKE